MSPATTLRFAVLASALLLSMAAAPDPDGQPAEDGECPDGYEIADVDNDDGQWCHAPAPDLYDEDPDCADGYEVVADEDGWACERVVPQDEPEPDCGDGYEPVGSPEEGYACHLVEEPESETSAPSSDPDPEPQSDPEPVEADTVAASEVEPVERVDPVGYTLYKLGEVYA